MLDVQHLASVDPVAFVLFVGTMLALFHRRIGVVPTLLGTAGAGELWHLLPGTI